MLKCKQYDCKADVPHNRILKFPDNTTVLGYRKENDESNYRDQISNIVTWCGNNNLLLNNFKTKEINIDLENNKTLFILTIHLLTKCSISS